MSNLSEGLIQQSAIDTTAKYISSLTKRGFSIDQAFEMLEVNDNIKQIVLEKLKEEQNN